MLFFIAVGAIFIDPHNYVSNGSFAPNGFEGISAAAAIIFFSYIRIRCGLDGRRRGI